MNDDCRDLDKPPRLFASLPVANYERIRCHFVGAGHNFWWSDGSLGL